MWFFSFLLLQYCYITEQYKTVAEYIEELFCGVGATFGLMMTCENFFSLSVLC